MSNFLNIYKNNKFYSTIISIYKLTYNILDIEKYSIRNFQPKTIVGNTKSFLFFKKSEPIFDKDDNFKKYDLNINNHKYLEILNNNYNKILDFYNNEYENYTEKSNIFLNSVLEYAIFLKQIEEICFYHNDNTKDIYSIEEDDNISFIYKYNELTTIIINFKESKILYDNDDNLSYGPLDFMNDNEYNNMIFVNMKIERNFGQNILSEYDYIIGENIFERGNDIGYELMMTDIYEKIKRNIQKSFVEILSILFPNIFNLVTDIKIGDVANNELWVWRRK